MSDQPKLSSPRSSSPDSTTIRPSAGRSIGDAGTDRASAQGDCHTDRWPECQAERRAAVIAAAVHKIATLGLEGLRVRDVANETGINHATLLYYFPTKEDLIRAVVENVTNRFDEFRARAAISFDQLGDDFKHATHEPAPRDRLRGMALLRAYLADVSRFMQRDPAAFIVLNELLMRALRDPMVRRTLDAYETTWRAALMRTIEAGVADGSFRADLDVQGTVTLIIVFLRGLSLEVDQTAQWIENAITVFADSLQTIVTPA